MFRASRQKFLRGRGAAHRGPTPSVCRQFFQPCALFLRLETENNVATPPPPFSLLIPVSRKTTSL